MIEQVRADLQRGLKKPTRGRHGLTPSQVLRSLVLRRIKIWDLRELERTHRRRLHLEQFHRFPQPPGPQNTMLSTVPLIA
jgi:IS5 family transposase